MFFDRPRAGGTIHMAFFDESESFQTVIFRVRRIVLNAGRVLARNACWCLQVGRSAFASTHRAKQQRLIGVDDTIVSSCQIMVTAVPASFSVFAAKYAILAQIGMSMRAGKVCRTSLLASTCLNLRSARHRAGDMFR